METESTAQTLDDRRASGVVTVLVGLAAAILTIVFVLETIIA
jgi:hypothetical protein